MNFKIGDIIMGNKDNPYVVTGKGSICKVTEIYGNILAVDVIKTSFKGIQYTGYSGMAQCYFSKISDSKLSRILYEW
jgi:hypothetical protein